MGREGYCRRQGCATLASCLGISVLKSYDMPCKLTALVSVQTPRDEAILYTIILLSKSREDIMR